MEYYKLFIPTIFTTIISLFFTTDFSFGQPTQNSNFMTFSNFTNLTSLTANQITPFAANQTTTFTVNPSNTLPGSEAFYAFHINSNSTQKFDNVSILFSGGFDTSNAHIIKADGNPKLVAREMGGLFFIFDRPATLNMDILVDGIINTHNTGESGFLLTASGQGVDSPPVVFRLINFPSVTDILLNNSITSNLLAEDSVGSRELKDNSITSNLLSQDSVMGRELAGVSKILFFDCRFRVVSEAGQAHGINFAGRGWVTVFGIGGAYCDTPGVEEDDLVFFGRVYSGAHTILPEYVNPQKDRILTGFSNYGEGIFRVGTYFSLPVIVIKK